MKIESEDDIESLKVSAATIDKWIAEAFWNGVASKLHLLNYNSDLVEFRESEACKFLSKTFGAIQS